MAELIPVIHTVDIEQVVYNIKLCDANGIKKVFLIDHRITDDSVKKTENYINYIREFHPTIDIGANFLGKDTKDAMILAEKLKLDYLWADKSYIAPETLLQAEEILDYQKKVWYFGCVAFKYQKPEKDLKWTCERACELMDVIVTSGSGTGKPPTIDKIKKIRNYIGNRRLAIASGIDSNNKKIFDEHVDYYMAASSIIDKDERIIESKIKEFLVK
jgi:predicted TIM-barrel enzyme